MDPKINVMEKKCKNYNILNASKQTPVRCLFARDSALLTWKTEEEWGRRPVHLGPLAWTAR
jgi:hypothetical protein